MAEKLPSRKRLHHSIPSWVGEGAVYFVTINTRPRGGEQLTKARVSELVLNSVRELHDMGKWWCRLVLLMPDHLHALLSFPAGVNMAKLIAQFKAFQAKHAGVIWQDGFFDHRLRSAKELETKAQY